ncbi:unnamed protein product [Strongylus vulgaris]|uniref:Uncharacterized protein n=1 Tax=Strongylus vulgaris TaxID=40348 RepID=A0A3P7IS64_STRVU|nr:unnamed protein product [Strongylus vulgaris]
MLKSMRREAKSMAAFHFAMEAAIKKDQNKLDVFQVSTSWPLSVITPRSRGPELCFAGLFVVEPVDGRFMIAMVLTIKDALWSRARPVFYS